MAVAVPDCWAGLRLTDVQRHRSQRPEWYKVELLDGVLVLTLRTGPVRTVIDRLAGEVAAALPHGHVVVTSNDRQPARDRAPDPLRRQGAIHEAAVSALRADLAAQVEGSGRQDLAVLLGAGWQAVPDGPLWWTDVCVVSQTALVDPVDRSELWRSAPPPLLIVEVTEPATAALDRTERAGAYAAGGCPWLLVIDPADPALRRRTSTMQLYDLRGKQPLLAARATDRISVSDPLLLVVDLSELSQFASAALDAIAAGEL